MTDAPIIYWHADDYGMTECSDRRIEACRDHLCSVSIVPNGDVRALSDAHWLAASLYRCT